MPLADVVAATTSRPAAAIRREGELGSLADGREADVTVLELVRGEHRLDDAAGESVVAEEALVPRWVVRAGVPLEIG
jgi:dihydroorotase